MKVTEIEPDRRLAWHMRGECWQRLGNHELALKDFNRVLEIWSEPESYFRRALSRIQIHDSGGARKDLAIALKLDPKFARAKQLMGSIHCKKTIGMLSATSSLSRARI